MLEDGGIRLIIDCFEDPAGVLADALFTQGETIFLASHNHGDHFSPLIYDFARHKHVSYVLSSDIPKKNAGLRLSVGESLTLGETTVTAFGSTDVGVSFLIQTQGRTIFHAGDLNFWHWREESTQMEIDEALESFLRCATPLIRYNIDIAFFPVDPRLGQDYDEGAIWFAKNVCPKVLIPMHFTQNPQAAIDFCQRDLFPTKTHCLTIHGQSITI